MDGINNLAILVISDCVMNLAWMDEKIPRLWRGNWMYNIVCFLLFKRKTKLSYREYMMLLYGINKRKLGEDKARQLSITQALEVYKSLHEGNLPPEDE